MKFIAVNFLLPFLTLNDGCSHANQGQPDEITINNYINWKDILTNKTTVIFSEKINSSLHEFTFIINGILKDSDSFVPHRVTIKNGAVVIQNLKIDFDEFTGWSHPSAADYVKMVDLNFDGYLDLRTLHTAGFTGQDWYFTWIYEPHQKKFVYNKQLFEMSALDINSINHEPTSYTREG